MSILPTLRERRAVLWLIPFLIAACLVGYFAVRKSVEVRHAESSADTSALFMFDPNTVGYFDLCRMGFSKRDALRIVKYRARGKVFEIPEDFASVDCVNESIYTVLRPYIVISPEYRLKPFKYGNRFCDNFSERKPNRQLTPFKCGVDTASEITFCRMGFSERQSAAIVRYREAIGGFRSVEEFEQCYVVDKSIAEILRPYLSVQTVETKVKVKFPLDINSADTTELKAVNGIGAKSAVAIVVYRKRLGGYYSVAQLAELPQITERNFEVMSKQIFADSCKIQKIRVNFATRDELSTHPYMNQKLIRNLLSVRQLKGGRYSKEDFLNNRILTAAEKVKLLPYLDFEDNPDFN